MLVISNTMPWLLASVLLTNTFGIVPGGNGVGNVMFATPVLSNVPLPACIIVGSIPFTFGASVSS
jgi:hypothetical protein